MAAHSFMSQVEVLSVTDTGRRRRWTVAEKVRIVEESFAAPRMASTSARRHGISRSLLTRWRREARSGLLSADQDRGRFAPVTVTRSGPPEPGHLQQDERDQASTRRVEIALPNGRRLLVDAALDAPALARLIQVLERA
jgi:transposase-like protein